MSLHFISDRSLMRSNYAYEEEPGGGFVGRPVPPDPIEAAARALYDCEKRRSAHCEEVLSRVAGKPMKDTMEPWEDCRDIYMGDARAALEAAVAQMGWPQIRAYQAEMRKGQSIFEDAGGFLMRGLRRLFGLPAIEQPVVTYQQAARAMLKQVDE